MSGDVCVVVGADCIADFTMHMITSQRITRGLKVMGVVLASRSCCVGSSAGRQREVILKDFLEFSKICPAICFWDFPGVHFERKKCLSEIFRDLQRFSRRAAATRSGDFLRCSWRSVLCDCLQFLIVSEIFKVFQRFPRRCFQRFSESVRDFQRFSEISF